MSQGTKRNREDANLDSKDCIFKAKEKKASEILENIPVRPRLTISQERHHRLEGAASCFVDFSQALEAKLLTYVLSDRHGNKMTHLGYRSMNLDATTLYLRRILATLFEKDPNCTMTFSLPLYPQGYLATSDFANLVSVDPRLWTEIISSSAIYFRRVHVSLSASFHQDDCKCANCSRTLNFYDPTSNTNRFAIGDDTLESGMERYYTTPKPVPGLHPASSAKSPTSTV